MGGSRCLDGFGGRHRITFAWVQSRILIMFKQGAHLMFQGQGREEGVRPAAVRVVSGVHRQ